MTVQQVLINKKAYTLQVPERPADHYIWDERHHEWMPCIARQQAIRG